MDDDLARPEVGRAAPQPRHRVVSSPRRQDRRGSRLSPRRQQQPAGDLLGFDFAGRGYTTLADRAGARATRLTAMDSVVKDTGERALLPPFTDEHEQLRETIGRWVRDEIVPHVDEWEEAREFPRELYTRAASSASSGSSIPRSSAARAATTSTTRSGPRSWPRAGASGGVGAGLGAHTGIATPPVFRFGTDGAARALPAAGDPRRDDRAPSASPSRAPAPTWPASAPRPAGWPAATWSTARRPSSPTESAPTSSSAR